MKTVKCAKCGSHRTSRRERKGFFQKTIMPGFGLYPWECNSCWQRFYSPERGHRHRPGERHAEGQVTFESTGHNADQS